MKIDRPSDAVPPPPPGAVDALATRTDRGTQAAGPRTAGPATTTKSSGTDTDSVRLSAASRAIGAAAGASVDDGFRADKVEALRMKVDAGEFHVDVHKVAERMINEAAELLETIVSVPK
ncbi:MAG: flagellar biosynthesis anti-sigma factor FlgM [Lautropia sp.]